MGLGPDSVLSEMSASPFAAFILCWIKPLKILNSKTERLEKPALGLHRCLEECLPWPTGSINNSG